MERDTIDRFIYCDIAEQHESSLYFINECQKVLGKKVEFLNSPYLSVANVIKQFRFINSRYGAKCSQVLKKRVRKEWKLQQKEPLEYVWGYDCNEEQRAIGIVEADSEKEHIFPLIERGLTKNDAHGILKKLGIDRPYMYKLGYQNNNCVGCVKGGMGYWNKIRIDFPQVFYNMAKLEREIGHTCLTEEVKGAGRRKSPLFLDELNPKRGRIEDEISEECSIACQMNIGG